MNRDARSKMPWAFLLGCLVLTAAGCGNSSSPGGSTGQPSPDCAAGDFQNTFDAIQKVIFEKHGCTQDVCHGSAQQGGLDLRPDAAYANLFEAASTSSSDICASSRESRRRASCSRSSPPQPRRAASTIDGSPMPNGLPPIREDELEAIRLWIEAGAPETGSVGDRDRHVRLHQQPARRLPAASEPITIKPLDPPPPGEGVQFVLPTYILPAHKEQEVCFATYYDI